MQRRIQVNKRRTSRCTNVLVFAGFALLVWWVVWFQFFRASFTDRAIQLAQIEQELKAHHRNAAVPEVKQVETKMEFYSTRDCNPRSLLHSKVLPFGSEQHTFEHQGGSVGSMRLVSGSGGHAKFYYHDRYVYSLFALDECVPVFQPMASKFILFADSPMLQQRQISNEKLDSVRRELLQGAEPPAGTAASFRVVFSSESAEYFGYQTYVNRLAFAQSQLGLDATWTRLLTCEEPDDIAEMPQFPTFTAPRHPYSARYVPINKPDVITKWFASEDAPREEVILVIDPDSWLLRPVYEKFITRVKPGYALGQQTYYTGSRTAQLLWKELCEFNCDRDMDLVGVPYVIHRDDLRALAPLWKYYVLKIKYLLEHTSPGHQAFHDKYERLDVDWASEMFGYNMAAAHLNIKHEIESELQVRDVDGERTEEACANKVSLHAGRAWLPKGHELAKPFIHTEGKSFRMYGDQVWCKCNFTASTVKPWPIPSEGMDFVSKHTLRLLHEVDEVYGPIPNNRKWRRNQDLRHEYSWTKT